MSPIHSDIAMEAESDETANVAIISTEETIDDAASEDILRADDFEAMKEAHMPEIPDLEVEMEVIHTWHIEGWRTSLGPREHGATFHCGNDPWRILFFPRGNNVDHASFYLEQGWEEGKAPEDWYACVQFMLVLWNPNDPTIFMHHNAQHRFTADEGDWGFTRFSELRKLFAPWEERGRPLVENESAKVTAYVRKVKDPTGVLWHNFVNYDSKKATGMVGLKNQGATCYLNSLLQSLYFTDSFRKIPTEDAQEYRNNSPYALQRLFYLLQVSDVAITTQELTVAFGWDSKQIFEQQDVQELSRLLMEKMEEKMKGTEADNSLERMFRGKMKTYISCINVAYESSRIEDFWDLQLNVIGNKNLDDSFKDYVQVETMDGENQYSAEGFGLQDARKGVIFESFPQVLHLQLKRFEYDFQRDTMMKINDRYEFPEVWDASPYLSDDADKSEDWTYHLHGVLVHSGDLNAGHYYAFIKPKKEGEFFKFDDERVTRATLKEAMDDNFGGEYTQLTNGTRQQERNPYSRTWSTKKSMNAYMLVYIRRNALDKIFLSDEELQPPEHLGKKFVEERELALKLRKERDEAHLYMEVQVSCTKMFREYGGFDIAEWKCTDQAVPSAPKNYRILKSSQIGTFIQSAAKDLDMDPLTTRAWVVVNRQNGTARPDAAVTTPELSAEEVSIKIGAKAGDLKLWFEDTPDRDENGKPLYGDSKTKLSELGGDRPIFLFLKYFDVDAQTLRGVGNFYAAFQDKVSDMQKPILKLLGFPENTEISMYEEIKTSMIDAMKLKSTLQASEIQEGDIVCVQKTLTEKQQKALLAADKITDVPAFYDSMLNRILVTFHPKVAVESQDSIFELQLSKKMTYLQFSQRVGERLSVDPTHVRFYPVNSNNGRAKAAIRHTTTQTLGQIMSPNFNTYATVNSHRSDALYYEVMEFSLSELEMRKNMLLWFLTEGITKEEECNFLIPKSGQMQDLVAPLMKKVGLAEDLAPRIRFYEAHGHKVFRTPSMDYAVASLNEFVTLYAEIRPEEEMQMGENDRIVRVHQFDKDPHKSPHGIPFLFVMKDGEVFKDTKERLSKRCGIKGKQFEKIKFAVVPRQAYPSRVEYLDDDAILSEKLTSIDDHLGMDHISRKSNWNRATTLSINEKKITAGMWSWLDGGPLHSGAQDRDARRGLLTRRWFRR